MNNAHLMSIIFRACRNLNAKVYGWILLLFGLNVLIFHYFAGNNRSINCEKSSFRDHLKPIWTKTLNTSHISTSDLSFKENVDDFKLILAYTTIYGNVFDVDSFGRTGYERKNSPRALDQCQYKCTWSTDKKDLNRSDAVVFHLYNNLKNKDFVIKHLPRRSSMQQKWVFMAREPQAFYYPSQLSQLDDMFNLTVTFQYDSDVVIPYGAYWSLSESAIRLRKSAEIDYFTGKKRMAVWVASNCKTSSRREEYVRRLQEHVSVDVYGKCGNLSTHTNSPNEFRKLIAKEYKFYLAFENSDCDDYISEKFWNSLQIGIIPVVRGHRIDYKKYAPPHSYIHADSFISVEKLAEYLNELANDKNLYNSYHEWRRLYDAKYKFFTTNSKWICDLCESVHTTKSKTVKISEFFSEDSRCFTYLNHNGRDREGEHVEDIDRQ